MTKQRSGDALLQHIAELPAEVARIRTSLGLSQRQAGELFGGGVNAFNRYENSLAAPSSPLLLLLRLLDERPELLVDVRRLKGR